MVAGRDSWAWSRLLDMGGEKSDLATPLILLMEKARRFARFFPWGPNEIAWGEMLAEIRAECRQRMRKTTQAMLALTCREEYAVGGAAAKHYLVALAYVEKDERGLLGLLRERVHLLDATQRGRLHHEISAPNPGPTECDDAIACFQYACPFAAVVDVCATCYWWSAPVPLNGISFRHCADDASDCHKPRSIACQIPNCDARGCDEHMDRASCGAPGCTAFYRVCLNHTDGYDIDPPGWGLCYDIHRMLCPIHFSTHPIDCQVCET